MNSSSLLDEYKLPDEPLLGGETYSFGLTQTAGGASNTITGANRPLSPPQSSNNTTSFSSNMFDDVLQDATPSSQANSYAPPTVNWAKTHAPPPTGAPQSIPQVQQQIADQASEQQIQLQQLQLQQQLRQLELQQQRLQQMRQNQSPVAAQPQLAQQGPPQYFLPNYGNGMLFRNITTEATRPTRFTTDLTYSHVPPPNNAFPPSVPASLDTIPTTFQAPPPVVPPR